MKRREQVIVSVTDHALLRYLEREFGLDVDALRDHLAGHALTGAQLGAAGVVIGRVKLVMVHQEHLTTVVTAAPKQHRHYRRQLGDDGE